MDYYGRDPSAAAADLQRELQAAADEAFSDVQNYVNFTLQRAYYKCSYECFEKSRKHEDISACVERCGAPMLKANALVQNEISRFQERLTRNLMVCQDRYEAQKMVQAGIGSSKEFEQCMEGVVREQMKMLPHLAAQLKSRLPSAPS
ncbi:hypothetical protein KP509_30G051900 [Ceratopteris richardii]|uniref:Protein FAM136A n=1 Tax=Ceratopteris richardii TaxID=49495 RepID=A0A8T2R3E6_CERRI|nr:hypothetical protein KP509_30G051900 [Ceratopteris richardii]